MIIFSYFGGQRLSSLEIGVDGFFRNDLFPWTPINPITDAQFPSENYNWSAKAWLQIPITPETGIKLSFERDPIIRNALEALIHVDTSFIVLDVGPRFGVNNTANNVFTAGMTSTISISWPGILFFSFYIASDIFSSLLNLNNETANAAELNLGFYIESTIIFVFASYKRFKETDRQSNQIITGFTSYGIGVDIFKKNVPYGLLFNVSYDINNKAYYSAAAIRVKESLAYVTVGGKVSLQLTRAFQLNLNFNAHFVYMGSDALKLREPKGFLFSTGLGFVLDTDFIGNSKEKQKTTEKLSNSFELEM